MNCVASASWGCYIQGDASERAWCGPGNATSAAAHASVAADPFSFTLQPLSAQGPIASRVLLQRNDQVGEAGENRSKAIKRDKLVRGMEYAVIVPGEGWQKLREEESVWGALEKEQGE